MRKPIQQETEYDYQLLVLKKEFTPDMDSLTKDFNSEENRAKREAYRANHTREQKEEVLEKWKLFMKEVSSNYPFFEYFEKHFKWHKKSCVISKTNWKLLPKKDAPSSSKPEIVRSSHPPQEAILFNHGGSEDVVASPFKCATLEEKVVKKVIEQNNYTNQCLGVIGKQLDRIEDKIDNKVLLQPGNPNKPIQTLEKPLVKLPTTRQAILKPKDQTALEIVAQKLEELVKKELVTPSPDHTTTSRDPRLRTLHAHTTSRSSSSTSSETEKEIEHLEDQFRGLQVNKLYQPKVNPTSLTKNWYPRPTPLDLQYEEKTTQFTVSSGKLYE